MDSEEEDKDALYAERSAKFQDIVPFLGLNWHSWHQCTGLTRHYWESWTGKKWKSNERCKMLNRPLFGALQNVHVYPPHPPTRKTWGNKHLTFVTLRHLQHELTKVINSVNFPERPEANLDQIWEPFISVVSSTTFKVLGFTLYSYLYQDWFDNASEVIYDLLRKKNKIPSPVSIRPYS